MTEKMIEICNNLGELEYNNNSIAIKKQTLLSL